MAVIALNSVRKFLQDLVLSFQENFLENRPSFKPLNLALSKPSVEEEEEISQPKFKVSLRDLKIISSALLHFRKALAKREELARAQEVADIDQRLYQLISELEREQNLKTKEEVFA